ncbi:MAG TPA: PIN domain-containing protein [Solirubrobacterales bacterium]
MADLKKIELRRLCLTFATSALTIAELARGPGATRNDLERERRRRHLHQVETSIDVLPFDLACARAYGVVAAAVERIGRKPRGARAVDLMIAATALSNELPLYTLNAKDFRGVEGLIEIIDASRHIGA